MSPYKNKGNVIYKRNAAHFTLKFQSKSLQKIRGLAKVLKINLNLRLYSLSRHVTISGFLNILTLFIDLM
ncbi:hypothetical protein BBM25_16615 [Vibrio parahaemolyticus]|nr:hypothetical protein [Vibrio parahaemolyticus]PWF70595.1 hypothetical protein CCD93_04290 [Vibrio sp. T21]EGR1736578.1 hypothetical protein [Vibrio parahaemolyticus]EGR1876186.1 hypothetical protein [Vibrio parahaemolyticus]EGR2250826.1 hypothetical protein [Vibrio parahaemolyticus]